MQRTLKILSALSLAAVTGAAAQGIGVKGGLSYGNVSNSGALPGTLDTRTGFAAGLALGSSQSLLGFGIEGLYAQRGVDATQPADERHLDYADVPVYLRVMLPAPGLAPYAYAGPQFSFELRCRANGAPCPETNRPSTTYAGVIGAGLRVGGGREGGGVSFEGRYVYGLTDLNLGTVTTSESYKTRSFLILAGLGF